MRKWLFVVLVLLFVAGCVSLTDQQVADITNAVKAGTEAVIKPIVQVAAPDLDPTGTGAAAGIASVAGLLVAYGVRALLQLIRKKPESE